MLTRRDAGAMTWLTRWGLRALSIPYLAVVAIRNSLFRLGWKRSHQARLPVISVGNLSVGGTGKSPVVSWLARWFRERHVRVAILSRGYGQLAEGQNDEALELELNHPDVPHLQHWDRVASATLADEELGMQLLLLDDGFQHRRLRRDLDIVLIDASEPASAQWPLPGGLFREPFSSLRRAHIVMLTRVDQAIPSELDALTKLIRRNAPSSQVLETTHQPAALMQYPDRRDSLKRLSGTRVLAFCGIGNPQSFFQSLESLGSELLDTKTWPDHHDYSASDIEEMARWCSEYQEASLVVCTMKDWVKIRTRQIGGLPLAALVIDLEILKGESEFAETLASLLPEAAELEEAAES